MALAVADSWSAVDTSGGATASVAVSGFNPGDLCVVLGYGFSNVPAHVFAAPTDNGGNTYTERSQTTHDATFRTVQQISETVVVTPPTSVQVNWNVAGGELSIAVLRITGADPSPFDAAATPRNLTADDPTSNSVVTVAADTILVAGITQDAAAVYSSVASFTIQEKAESSGFTDFAAATRIVSAQDTYAAAWVTGGSADYSLGLVAYKGLVVAVQALRPDADIATTGWATAPLFSKINEESADGTVITATAS